MKIPKLKNTRYLLVSGPGFYRTIYEESESPSYQYWPEIWDRAGWYDLTAGIGWKWHSSTRFKILTREQVIEYLFVELL